MDRRWWNSRIICPCWFAWTTIDGCNNRWRNAQISDHSSIFTGRREGKQAIADRLKVGVDSLGYIAESTQEAVDDFFQDMLVS